MEGLLTHKAGVHGSGQGSRPRQWVWTEAGGYWVLNVFRCPNEITDSKPEYLPTECSTDSNSVTPRNGTPSTCLNKQNEKLRGPKTSPKNTPSTRTRSPAVSLCPCTWCSTVEASEASRTDVARGLLLVVMIVTKKTMKHDNDNNNNNNNNKRGSVDTVLHMPVHCELLREYFWNFVAGAPRIHIFVVLRREQWTATTKTFSHPNDRCGDD